MACSALVGIPCCLRVRSANVVWAQAAKRFSTCCVTENVRLIVTSSALIDSTCVMLGTAGGGILTVRRLRYATNTISTGFLGLSTRWIPSHVRLAGNLAADTAAKAALLILVSNLTLPHSDYFSLIRTLVHNQWQSSWSLKTQNKLLAHKPMVNSTKSCWLPRRNEIIIHRLRIGYTFLTHGHLLKKKRLPQCSVCQTPLTVEHVLLLGLT